MENYLFLHNIETLAKYLLLTVAHPKRQSWKNQTVFQSLRISQKLKRTHTHTHTYTQNKNQPTKQIKTTGLQLYENVLQDTGKPFYLEKKENARARPVRNPRTLWQSVPLQSIWWSGTRSHGLGIHFEDLRQKCEGLP